MVRNRGRKSLYEVFGKNKPKSGYTKLIERLKPAGSTEEPQTAAETPIPHRMPAESMLKWPRKPRLFQFNAGRVEISIPYQLAIAIVLAIVFIALVFYRLGQISYKNVMDESPNQPQKASNAVNSPKIRSKTPVAAKNLSKIQRPAIPAKSKGSNRIVIQTWAEKAQLEPVKWYFAKSGIKTEIRKIGGVYYLLTAEKYQNPQTPGTDGHKALQRIVKLGTNYKPPSGYATFGKKPFHDAYGMKFDD